MKTYPVVIPEYYKEFHCTGKECTDTCCQNWGVYLDKKTYKLYQNLPKTGNSPLESGYIVRNKDKKMTLDYAMIRMCGEKNRCPFLTEDQLCGIYLKYGSEYMSYTCQFYPRMVNNNCGEQNYSMAFSCPEVVKIIMDKKEPLLFLYEQSPKQEIWRYHYNQISSDTIQKRPITKNYAAIRDAGIALLQYRNYLVSERLIVLAMLMEKISALEESLRFDEVEKLCTDFVSLIKQTDSKTLFSNFKKNLSIQMLIAKECIAILGVEEDGGEKERNLILETCQYMEFEKSNEQSALVYHLINDRWMEKFMDQEGSICLEHFLVNHFYCEMMPFGVHKTIRESMIALCASYLILKMLLCGQTRKNGEITRELFEKTLYLFARHFLHNSSFSEIVKKITVDLEIHSVGGMYLMVHD